MEEKIYFKSKSGIKLCGILSIPTSSFDVPVVILCHGFKRDKNNFTNTKIVESLDKKNIATFRIDLFGHGESEGAIENVTVSESTENILSAIDLMEQKSFPIIGLIASSFGATASVVAASKTDKIAFLVLKSPVSDYLNAGFIRDRSRAEMENWRITGSAIRTNTKGEETKLNYSFFEDCTKTKVYKAAKKIKVPTLIVHGEKDELVPALQSEKLSTILEKCKLEIINGAGHKYSKKSDFSKMLNLIVAFAIKHTKS